MSGKYPENVRKISEKCPEFSSPVSWGRIGDELGTNWGQYVANLLQWAATWSFKA